MFNTKASPAVIEGASNAEAPSALPAYVTLTDIERLLEMGIPVFLQGGQQIRRIIALPAPHNGCGCGPQEACSECHRATC